MDWVMVWESLRDAAPDWDTTAALAGAASALAAFWTIHLGDKVRSNERILQHLITTLERTYSVLAGPEGVVGDRLAWLTAARLIEEYKASKPRLKDKLLRSECESHEEHWRRKIFVLLEPLSMDGNFFATHKIAPISGLVLFDFAEWQPGVVDPLNRYEKDAAALASLKLSQRWVGFRSYTGRL